MKLTNSKTCIEFSNNQLISFQFDFSQGMFAPNNIFDKPIEANLFSIKNEIEFINNLEELFENTSIVGDVLLILPAKLFNILTFPLEKKLLKDEIKLQVNFEIEIHTNENPDKFIKNHFLIGNNSNPEVAVFYLQKDIVLRLHKFAARNNWNLKLIEHPAVSAWNFAKSCESSENGNIFIYRDDETLVTIISNSGKIMQINSENVRLHEINQRVNERLLLSRKFFENSSDFTACSFERNQSLIEEGVFQPMKSKTEKIGKLIDLQHLKAYNINNFFSLLGLLFRNS